MPTTYSLSQAQGSASTGTYVTLYSTGASTRAIISNLMIANQATSTVTVRVGVMGSAGTPSAAQWLLYDVVISPNDTLSIGPLSLGTSQFIRCSSSANTCTFSAAVAEIS